MTFRATGRTQFLLTLILSICISACGGGGNASPANTTAAGPITAGPITGTSGGTVATASYVLTWDQVVDPSVTGYKIYWAAGPFNSNVQIHTIDVGAPTSYQFTPSTLGLSVGTTIYVSVAAVGNGVESPLSNQVSVVLQ